MKSAATLLVLSGFGLAACSQPIQQHKPCETAVEEQVVKTDPVVAVEKPVVVKEPEVLPPPDPQAILDEALEFCRAAKDFWQQGEPIHNLYIQQYHRLWLQALRKQVQSDVILRQQ